MISEFANFIEYFKCFIKEYKANVRFSKQFKCLSKQYLKFCFVFMFLQIH